MSYFGVSVVISYEKSSGASFLDKSMKKGLGYSHTKPAKISIGKSDYLF